MPHTEPDPADRADAPAALSVREVIAMVREWIDRDARHLPDFAGAYLWGGITALPPDAPFRLYRDVDVVVVLTQGAPEDDLEIFYQAVMLEVIFINLDEHQNAESVLANPSAGPNLATTQILADPLGILVPLQRAVAADFSRRRWIRARCDAEQDSAEKALDAMRQADTPAARIDAVRAFLSALMGLLAVAQLKRPTTRRTLALLGELLDAQGRPDLHEAALRIMGSQALSRADVRALLDQLISAFDQAAAVNRTPVPYGFAIRPHLRPYYLDGTLEMIDEGNHREAMYWVACLDTVYYVLGNDAPLAEKPAFAAQHHGLLAALGCTSDETWAARVDEATWLAPQIYRLADEFVSLAAE